jgi:hypothetical protein
LHQLISEDGESLIVAADSYVGDDSVEALEAQVCLHTVKQHTYHLHRYLLEYQQEFIVDNTAKENLATYTSI